MDVLILISGNSHPFRVGVVAVDSFNTATVFGFDLIYRQVPCQVSKKALIVLLLSTQRLKLFESFVLKHVRLLSYLCNGAKIKGTKKQKDT